MFLFHRNSFAVCASVTFFKLHEKSQSWIVNFLLKLPGFKVLQIFWRYHNSQVAYHGGVTLFSNLLPFDPYSWATKRTWYFIPWLRKVQTWSNQELKTWSLLHSICQRKRTVLFWRRSGKHVWRNVMEWPAKAIVRFISPLTLRIIFQSNC